MKHPSLPKSLLLAALMGALTVFFCLILGDGVFHLTDAAWSSLHHRGNPYVGRALFWGAIAGLPLLFRRWVGWRHTLINLPLYFLLYFPVDLLFGTSIYHCFLSSGGFIEFPPSFHALLTAPILWGLQSVVYLILWLVGKVIHK